MILTFHLNYTTVGTTWQLPQPNASDLLLGSLPTKILASCEDLRSNFSR